MLPPGLTAQPVDRDVHHHLRALHPGAQTVIRLLVGACSCDLVRARHLSPREDERHHRERHRRAGGGREPLLEAIQRHRRGADIPAPGGGWPRALADFVAEHARNAGPTLYVLWYGTTAGTDRLPRAVSHESRAALVRDRPDGWLEEGVAVMVVP